MEQHRAVPCGQHKPVAVGPVGLARIEPQKLREQNGRDIRHAHRHAGVAGFRLLDGIHGKRPNRIGHVAKFGVPRGGKR